MYDHAITAAFEVMVFIFFYAAFTINKKHAPMQMLFLGVGFFMQLINLDIMRQIAVEAGYDSIAGTVGYGYNAVMYVTVVVLSYFFIVFVWDVLGKYRATEVT